MIPKIIHYCWFGRNPKTKLIENCIKSWKKYCPDYKIIEWNEDNVDLNLLKFAKEAYHHKKYAFVSDQVRFKVMYEHGGIYLDTDVELIKNLDDLLNQEVFMGMEVDGLVNPGLIIGCVRNSNMIKKLLHIYENLSFSNEDGTLNQTTVVSYTTQLINEMSSISNKEINYLDGITIYPVEFFNPIDVRHEKNYLTNKTYSIHHFHGSWLTDKQKKDLTKRKILRKVLGVKVYNLLLKIKKTITNKSSRKTSK